MQDIERPFSFSLPDMILGIKSDINKIIEDEMKKAGLRNIELKSPPMEPVKPPDNMITTDPGPKCRFKIQAPKMPAKPLMSENVNDDELVDITLQAIEASYKQKWAKLTDAQRKDRIKDFANTYTKEKGLSSENISKIYESLRIKMLVEKSIKAKDFEYDEGRGIILSIPSMLYDTSTGTISMKRQNHTDNDAQSERDDTVSAASQAASSASLNAAKEKMTPKKTPKLVKSMARLKR